MLYHYCGTDQPEAIISGESWGQFPIILWGALRAEEQYREACNKKTNVKYLVLLSETLVSEYEIWPILVMHQNYTGLNYLPGMW